MKKTSPRNPFASKPKSLPPTKKVGQGKTITKKDLKFSQDNQTIITTSSVKRKDAQAKEMMRRFRIQNKKLRDQVALLKE